MSRTLLIMRHAKAAQSDRGPDAERPLTPRGQADAAAAAAWLQLRGHVPELVVCSPARRARETWEALSLTATVHYDRRLYSADTDDLLDIVREVDDGIGVLMLVGHNPGLSDLSALLDPAGRELRTSGIAVHALDASWAEFGPGVAPLAETHTARAS